MVQPKSPDIESIEINNAQKFIDENFADIIIRLSECRGRIILSGMGKSGHIAGKIDQLYPVLGLCIFYAPW